MANYMAINNIARTTSQWSIQLWVVGMEIMIRIPEHLVSDAWRNATPICNECMQSYLFKCTFCFCLFNRVTQRTGLMSTAKRIWWPPSMQPMPRHGYGGHLWLVSTDDTENLIPDVNDNIVNCLIVLNEITSNDPHIFLNSRDLSTPKIISKVWNSFSSSTSKNEIESIVNGMNNVTPRMLELLQLDDPVERVIDFRDRVLDYLSKLFPGAYSEQSDRVKKSISEVGFNAIWDIIKKMMPSVMLSLSQISGKTSSDSIEFARTMWTGLDFVGNGEVIEKITSGIDAKTYWNLSDNIKSYQMHAAERLATILGGSCSPRRFQTTSHSEKNLKILIQTMAKNINQLILRTPLLITN